MLACVQDGAVAQPTIYITQTDYDQLSRLVGAAADGPPGSTLLREELDRAIRVGPGELPRGFVKLGSVVRYRDRFTRKVRTVQLVLPEEADIDADRISVLSPVGAAILGVTRGQEFIWEASPGRTRVLQILSVRNGHEAA